MIPPPTIRMKELMAMKIHGPSTFGSAHRPLVGRVAGGRRGDIFPRDMDSHEHIPTRYGFPRAYLRVRVRAQYLGTVLRTLEDVTQ